MRVFLDTNVLVSAFATRGLCADLLRHVLAEHDLVIGQVVLSELRRVLMTRIKVPLEIVGEIERMLGDHEIVPKPARPSGARLRDEADRWVLASAIEGKADVLVTGDRDLLEAAHEAPIRILDPRAFWELSRNPPAGE